MNRNVYKRMKNPYLQLFYLIVIESSFRQRSLARTLIEFNRDYVINLFDFVAICCKYLDNASLKEVLEDKIRSDIEKGNL